MNTTEAGTVIRGDKKESFIKKRNTTEEGKVIRKDKKESFVKKGTQQMYINRQRHKHNMNIQTQLPTKQAAIIS